MKKLYGFMAAGTLLALQPAFAARNGADLYMIACMNCHAAGLSNSPMVGDKDAWAPRINTGKPALYESALKGKGRMPAKGGWDHLADHEVIAAVDYMVSQSQ